MKLIWTDICRHACVKLDKHALGENCHIYIWNEISSSIITHSVHIIVESYLYIYILYIYHEVLEVGDIIEEYILYFIGVSHEEEGTLQGFGQNKEIHWEQEITSLLWRWICETGRGKSAREQM